MTRYEYRVEATTRLLSGPELTLIGQEGWRLLGLPHPGMASTYHYHFERVISSLKPPGEWRTFFPGEGE